MLDRKSSRFQFMLETSSGFYRLQHIPRFFCIVQCETLARAGTCNEQPVASYIVAKRRVSTQSQSGVTLFKNVQDKRISTSSIIL